MTGLRKRRLTEREIGKIMNNSQSDLSSENRLLMNFNSTSIDSADEDLLAKRQ